MHCEDDEFEKCKGYTKVKSLKAAQASLEEARRMVREYSIRWINSEPRSRERESAGKGVRRWEHRYEYCQKMIEYYKKNEEAKQNV